MRKQRTLIWNERPLPLEVLGEKPHKLMELKQAKFPVPDFFTIVADGSGEVHIDDSVRNAYDHLQRPLIARSAHPMEGNGFSFSGRFQSLERVTRLTDSPQDEFNYVSPIERPENFPQGTDIFALEDEWWSTRTFSLERAYRDIVESANPDGGELVNKKVQDYLKQNAITGFNHNDMNLLLMEQRKIQVFGMFLTEDQARPDEMVIHFQDRRVGNGDWVIYDKVKQKLGGEVSGDLEGILLEFGRLATQAQKQIKRVQQIEIGYSDRGIELYQARDINIKNATSVPRFAHYKTLSVNLHANGMGYFYLPILVIDALDSIHDGHFPTKDETLREAIRPYKEQIRQFVQANPEFIAVVKDGELFTGVYSENPERLFGTKKEVYAGLNAITGKAKVVFRGKCQNAIRHEDWDLIETGGINVWMTETEQMANLFIHNQLVGEHAEWKARHYASGAYQNKPYVAPNVTLVDLRRPIKTGDFLHVLANTDGTFVWRD